MVLTNFDKLAGKLSKPELVTTDPAELEKYSHDATHEFAHPLAVVMAENADDVKAVIRYCGENNLAVTARGAGTGLSGGCVPSPNSIVLSTERMDHLEIDATNRIAICGPGVITKDVVDAAAPLGLTYPPDPASFDESTLGGNIAENAGGLRCKRFGVTRDYVIGLKAILADGREIRTGIFADDSGFDFGDLLVGSEGTLAVVTEIALRLIETPRRGTTILVAFDSPPDAARTVSQITSAGIVPTVLEFLDGDAAACSNEYEHNEGLADVGAILLIETSGEDSVNQTNLIEEICRNNNCSHLQTESDQKAADSLWQIRRNLSKASKAIAPLRISEDVVVPNSKFPDLVQFVAELNRVSEFRINSFGHAGDGNLHVNFLATEDSPTARQKMEVEIEKLLRKAIGLGGSLSGEHGIGLSKRLYLDLEFDKPTLAAMKMIKQVFDPTGILNPGKIFN